MAVRRVAARGQNPTELRLTRRYLMVFLLCLPLLFALAGFGMHQSVMPDWPAALVEEIPRGRILAADGTILAEGAVGGRSYPQGELAAHLVGFSGAVQPDGTYGLEGLEYTLESTLHAGHDVFTTIDPTQQAAAESKLAQSIAEAEAENGAVVILEARTGRILAAASYPVFDPNAFIDSNADARTNRAFLQHYEPGSVMKPFVIASLLENGRLSTEEIVPAPMHLRVGWKTFQDVARHDPELSVRDILRYSSNTAMLHLTERFTPQELYGWLRHFGFGQELALESAFTRSGQLNWWEDWVPQDQASITIGQSIATTPLQLAAAYSIFANDGVLVQPFLVEGEHVPEPRRVLSPEVARTVRSMLAYTVDESGLHLAEVPGVEVAGKSGTADVFDLDELTYIDGDYSLTFAGMFPAERPDIVMVVTVQKPRASTSSTLVAAPLFRAIGSEIVAGWGLAPMAPPVARTP